MPVIRTLIIFAIAFSLVSLPSVLSNDFFLPSIPVVRAQQETTSGSWYPAGAQEQTLSISQGDGASITQVNWLLTNQVDSEDWPLTATQQGASTVNCSGNANVLCSLPVPDHGYFEIEFNLANVLWGIPMQYGNSASGVELRQGIAHLINKQSFTANNPACLGVACVPDDQAVPVCTISVGCTGGGPAVVTAINTAGSCSIPIATANTCFFVRTTEPRKSLGEGLAQDICALFSPAWGAWTTFAGQRFSCDNSNTGSGNSACGGGSCPFLQEIEGPSQFCGFNTSTNGTPINCWGLGTFGFGQVFPFDSTTYFEYNSLFATKTTVTCTSADCSTNVPGSPCASVTFTPSASDYNYVCSPTYDSLSQVMEFSPCLSATGDPASNVATPTFVNCSGGTVGSGTGSTSCISASPMCTAISAGYQAEDYFGSHVFTIPVWSGLDTQARLSCWHLGSSSPGIITAFGGGYLGSANYFSWLNAYCGAPAVAGTYRQSLLTTVDSLNPFDFTTVWDGYVMSNIYDSLFVQNPLCSQAPPAGSGVNQCSSILQNIDWMTTSHSFLCYPGGPACTSTTMRYGNSTYFANTSADLRLTLNRSNNWHDGGPVTAWDVKYSFINLNATGAYQATSLANISHINVLDEYTLDLNLKAEGPFTELLVGGVTIIPGHVWSACGASTWNTGVTGKNIVGTSIVNASEDNCVGHFGAPSIATVGGVRADSPIFDPMTNNFLIGSGPYTCESIGGSGHPAVGTLGGGCSIDNTQTPAFGLGDFTLNRTGCTLTASGTTCGIAGSSSDYFRSSGSLANYVWSGDIGSGSADFSKVLTVNSCHSSSPSANCPHWAQGIGNPGGTGTNAVGLSQRLKVNSLKGISWIGFSTEKTTGTQLILACKAAYTIPLTTITPCTATNAGWTGTVLPGIGGYASTLYEVGSAVLGVSTSTLVPASVAGCPIAATAYPNGNGYDC